jgi:hypothetical protein
MLAGRRNSDFGLYHKSKAFAIRKEYPLRKIQGGATRHFYFSIP